MTLPLIRNGFGVGDRVTAITNSLTRSPGGISFVWRENDHCPLPWNQIFPNGIPSVEFVEAEPDFATYVPVHPAADYNAVMDAMAGRPMDNPPALGICARFHRNPSFAPKDYVDRVVEVAEAGSRVFVLSDICRSDICLLLQGQGFVPVLPESSPLIEDLKRDPADLLRYLNDWKTLLEAKDIVGKPGSSNALNPAPQRNIRIHNISAP